MAAESVHYDNALQTDVQLFSTSDGLGQKMLYAHLLK